jgi:hypothetical protein
MAVLAGAPCVLQGIARVPRGGGWEVVFKRPEAEEEQGGGGRGATTAANGAVMRADEDELGRYTDLASPVKAMLNARAYNGG